MYVYRISSYLIFVLIQTIIVVDTARTGYPSTSRQMCTKLQSMLSYGKYQTSQISSNITYVSRFYTQNFLTYSMVQNLLIFIEPKYQIHVYNAETIKLLVNISTTDVAIAASTSSLISNTKHDLFFLYETSTETNLISLRTCQVRFNMITFLFDDIYCIETIKIQYDQSNLRIHGFTIKRDHAGTKKSLLFISTDIGIIYSIFDTHTGSLIGESSILNETLNEGSIVISASGLVYYASRQEHLIYELSISKDFHLRYGKVIKQKGIKYPFGLIADECNHLYITTRSMIWIMYVQENVTIRSVFSKSSDLPVILERLNATTYAYTTITKHASNPNPPWIFNILFFTEPDRVTPPTRHRVVNLEEKLDLNETVADVANTPKLWPILYPSSPNTTKNYVQFTSMPRRAFQRFRKRKRKKSKQRSTTRLDDISQTFTLNPLTDQSIIGVSEESQWAHTDDNSEFYDNSEEFEDPTDQFFDDDIPIDDASVNYEPFSHFTTPMSPVTTPSVYNTQDSSILNGNSQSFLEELNKIFQFSKNQTINIENTTFSTDDIHLYFTGQRNLSKQHEEIIQTFLKHPLQQLSTNQSILSNTTLPIDLQSILKKLNNGSKITDIENVTFTHEDIKSYLQTSSSSQPFLSKYSTSTKEPLSYLLGRDNLTKIKEEAIRQYLAKNPILKKPKPIISGGNLSQDYSDDIANFNYTSDTGEILFSGDDLKSFLQGYSNISDVAKKNIQNYLSTIKPEKTQTDEESSSFSPDDLRTYLIGRTNLTEAQEEAIQNYLTKYPLSSSDLLPQDNSSSEHYSEDTGNVLFTNDDLKSFLQGSSNISNSVRKNIQNYLANKQPSTLSTSTAKPRKSSVSSDSRLPDAQDTYQSTTAAVLPFSVNDLKGYLQGSVNLTQTQEEAIQQYLTNTTNYNYTSDTNEVLFTNEDLKSFLHGHSNISDIIKKNIQKYLSKESSLPSHVFSKIYSSTTTSTKTLSTVNINQTIDFSIDQLKSYLLGRSNLTETEKETIRNYLHNNPRFIHNLLQKPSTSTRKPRRTISSLYNASIYSNNDSNMSYIEGSSADDYSDEIQQYDNANLNYTSDTGEVLFTNNDLQSFLQGYSNISHTIQKNIQNYLAKESYFPTDLFSKSLTSSTSKPSQSLALENSTFVHDNNSTRTTHIQMPSFSTDDLREYLLGRANFTQIQAEIIQKYLSKHPLSPSDLLHKYLTNSSSNFSKVQFPEIDSYNTGNYNYTSDTGDLLFTNDDLKSFLQGNSNISDTIKANIQNYLSKESSIPTTSTMPSTILPFSADTLKSYLLGRENLTKAEEEVIQQYLAKNPAFLTDLIPKYPSIFKKPRPNVPDGNLSLDVSEEIDSDNTRNYNYTSDTGDILFTNDDLKSFLQGNLNISDVVKKNIQNYLSKESSIPADIFSKHSTTSTVPSTILPFSVDDLKSYLLGRDNITKAEEEVIQKYLAKNPTFLDNIIPKYPSVFKKPRPIIPGGNLSLDGSEEIDSNITSDTGEILFTNDDLKSFLQGYSNISDIAKKNIQQYLAEQSVLSQDLFSKLSTTTKKPEKILSITADDIKDYLEGHTNLTKTKQEEIETYLAKNPLLIQDLLYRNDTESRNDTSDIGDNLKLLLQGRVNISDSVKKNIQNYLARQSTTTTHPSKLTPAKTLNQTIDKEIQSFSTDDLKAYLFGRSNLTNTTQEAMKKYLSENPLSINDLFLKHRTSTRLPRRFNSSDKNISEEHFEEIDTYDTGGNYNYTSDTGDPLFTNDDLKSFLQGNSNISDTIKKNIQNYLSKESSISADIFSKHSTTSTSTMPPTTLPFSVDDLKSYLLGHDNITKAEEEVIQKYLAKNPTFLGNIIPKYPSVFKKQRPIIPDGNLSLDGSEEIDSNITSDTGEILFTNDDLKSFLQGNSNISDTIKKNIQNYLSKESSISADIFSKHSTTSTVPSTILPFSVDDLKSYLLGRSNLTKMEEEVIQQYLVKNSTFLGNIIPKYPSVFKKPRPIIPGGNLSLDGSEEIDSNIISDTGEILFTNDDLKSFLQGYSNISDIAKKNIQNYLSKESSFPESFFSKFSTSTTEPRRNQSLNDDYQSIVFDPKYFNLSMAPEDILFTIDDLQSYLQGQANLSRAQEEQIQAILTNLTSVTNTTLEDYLVKVRQSTSSMPTFISTITRRQSVSTSAGHSPLDKTSTSTLPSPYDSSNVSDFRKSIGISDDHKGNITSLPLTTASSITQSSVDETQILSPETADNRERKIKNTTLHPSLPSRKPNTTLSPSLHSLTSLSTISQKYPHTSSSNIVSGRIKYVDPTLSEEATTELSYSTLLTSLSSELETTSEILSMQTSIATSSASTTSSSSSSSVTTDKLLLTTKDNQYTSKSIDTSTQSSPLSHVRSTEIFSTIFPSTSKSMISTKSSSDYQRMVTNAEQTKSTLPYSTTTTVRRHRTRIPKITRWRTQTFTPTLPSTISSHIDTTIPEYLLITSTQQSVWRSQWDPREQKDVTIIRPSSLQNDPDAPLSNELFNEIFRNISMSTNSSADKLVLLNLSDHPPSTWNLSLNSNDSILLNILLPIASYPSSSNSTTNLTFTNIEADRFHTNINGMPIHLQVDRVETKQFSLQINATHQNSSENETNKSISDIVIGHVKSEQFQLNLTKSDNMHVYVKEVDSATAEVYLDSNFCTNESSLEINLNLKKNGTLRYGNRTPINIGPVYTRVHMLKDSCDREQPLTLFFDICQRQNPCSNGGTCVAVLPDFKQLSSQQSDLGHVGYKCQCPLHISGEHCEYLQYPLGYCLNNGVLFQLNDPFNQTIEKCFCPKGFHGEHCEENIDDCINRDCSKHGICIDGVDTYQCSCFDGYYGYYCERTHVQTVLLQAASRSFGVVAILLILGIMGLVVASDIHTYLTRKHQKKFLLSKIPRATSEIFENSVLLLGFRDAPIELTDLSDKTNADQQQQRLRMLKQRQKKRTPKTYRRQTVYQQLSRRSQLVPYLRPSTSRKNLLLNQSNQTIL